MDGGDAEEELRQGKNEYFLGGRGSGRIVGYYRRAQELVIYTYIQGSEGGNYDISRTVVLSSNSYIR